MKVDKNKLVRVHYTLYAIQDGEESEVEKTAQDAPLEYIHGMGTMLDDFEQNLLGLEEGEKFDFVLNRDQAYGERSDEYITTLPREVFFVDGEFDDEVVYPGASVPMMNSDGQSLQGIVLEINDEGVKMDFNHPLADMSLHFVGEIASVSDPTPEEVQQLMSLGGGCDCCSGSGCHGCH